MSHELQAGPGSAPDLPIVARARDTHQAAQLYKAGVTDAVPETLEASLQLSEAVLVDVGLAMGPVIASIHEKRAELRAQIMAEAQLEVEPRLGRRRVRRTGADVPDVSARANGPWATARVSRYRRAGLATKASPSTQAALHGRRRKVSPTPATPPSEMTI